MNVMQIVMGLCAKESYVRPRTSPKRDCWGQQANPYRAPKLQAIFQMRLKRNCLGSSS